MGAAASKEVGDNVHDPRIIANEFIKRGIGEGHPLTHIQVQKSVYFAHAGMLVEQGRPLVTDMFEAWQYGPVLAAIYHNLSSWGAYPIDKEIPLYWNQPTKLRPIEMDIIEEVFQHYSRCPAGALITITHRAGTPWDQARKRKFTYITHESIRRYHSTHGWKF